MSTDPEETQKLIARAQSGEPAAFEELFGKHRGRLRQAVALRMDRRLAARLDASDIVQETYLEAARRLPKYLGRPAMPFYLWLRWLAREKVIAAHRRHLGADKRALDREIPLLPDDTSAEFVSGILRTAATPSQELAAAEIAGQLRQALGELDQDERDLILWRHFEQLTAAETAQLLEISEAAASKRYIRALEKLRTILLGLGISRAK